MNAHLPCTGRRRLNRIYLCPTKHHVWPASRLEMKITQSSGFVCVQLPPLYGGKVDCMVDCLLAPTRGGGSPNSPARESPCRPPWRPATPMIRSRGASCHSGGCTPPPVPCQSRAGAVLHTALMFVRNNWQRDLVRVANYVPHALCLLSVVPLQVARHAPGMVRPHYPMPQLGGNPPSTPTSCRSASSEVASYLGPLSRSCYSTSILVYPRALEAT